MAKQSKITVKHYLNKNLKPIRKDGKNKYPIYVQVIYKCKVYKFKSENGLFEYLSDEDLKDEKFIIYFKKELKRVEKCVLLLSKYNRNLLTSKDIHKLSKPLNIIIENNFKKLIEKEIKDTPKLLTEISYTEINDLLLFFNAFKEFESKSKVVKNVIKCISNIDCLNYNNYNSDFIAIDLFTGNNYIKIYSEIFKYSFQKEETDALINDFQKLTEFK